MEDCLFADRLVELARHAEPLDALRLGLVAEMVRRKGLDGPAALLVHQRRTTQREQQLAMLAALALLGHGPCVGELAAILRDPAASWEQRHDAAHSLGLLADRGDLRAYAELRRALLAPDDPDGGQAAATALAGTLALASALLVEALRTETVPPPVRARAAELLCLSEGPEVVPALLEALADPAAVVRFWAIYSLATLDCRSARPWLVRLALGDDAEVDGWWSVSRQARLALGRLDTGEWPADAAPA